MPEPDKSHINDGVLCVPLKRPPRFDENLYLAVRQKEGRIYPDNVVKNLPAFSGKPNLEKEWTVRKRSFSNLTKYLSTKHFKSVLEVGCGCGWLTNGLSIRCGLGADGVDLNLEELKQASRVFSGNKNLRFIYGNILENIFPDSTYDVVLFAASIQYFADFDQIIKTALSLLTPGGEIHIIDSHFYSEANAVKAEERTRLYYEQLGFPAMANYYHHHKILTLKQYNYINKNKSRFLLSKLLRFLRINNEQVFPWIVIRK